MATLTLFDPAATNRVGSGSTLIYTTSPAAGAGDFCNIAIGFFVIGRKTNPSPGSSFSLIFGSLDGASFLAPDPGIVDGAAFTLTASWYNAAAVLQAVASTAFTWDPVSGLPNLLNLMLQGGGSLVLPYVRKTFQNAP